MNGGSFDDQIWAYPGDLGRFAMNTPVISADSPVTIIGGAPLAPGDLDLALAHAPRLVAADGGGDTALAAGHLPEAVIGDMDSLSAAAKARLGGRLHEIAEQESTDFDKALRSVAAPLVIAVGVSGGRFDHDLAALNVLVRRPWQPCIMLTSEMILFVAPPRIALDLPGGSTFSLFPMGPVTGRSQGLEWPIEGLDFSPAGQSGTSNRVTGPVVMEMDAPLMLTLLPRESLAEVVRRLAAPEAAGGASRWPAPAR